MMDDDARSRLGEDRAVEPDDQRWLVNSYPDYQDLSGEQIRDVSTRIRSRVDAIIPFLLEEIRTKIGPVAEASDSRFSCPDFTLYLGVGGQALALWALHGYWKRIEGKSLAAQACLVDCHRALACALELTESDPAPNPGYYCGAAGLHALAATIHGERDSSIAAEHAQRVLDMLDVALACPETELLYGRSGYLYSLLVSCRHIARSQRSPELEGALEAVFDSLLRDGKALASEVARQFPQSPHAGCPLAYAFPVKDGHVYLGAAHGLAGVLFALMHLPDRCLRARAGEVITGALDHLVSMQNESGNFPVGIDKPDADLVHWCHGAPGIIPTLCKAHDVFGDDRYLAAAFRAADCVWSRGLLRKGLGVCHGIAGSMLSLLTLYRKTGNGRYLYRALRLCEATWSEPVLAAIGRARDDGRYRPGTPDFPYSLMEGKAGLLYAYVSVQQPDRATFPGYDGDDVSPSFVDAPPESARSTTPHRRAAAATASTTGRASGTVGSV